MSEWGRDHEFRFSRKAAAIKDRTEYKEKTGKISRRHMFAFREVRVVLSLCVEGKKEGHYSR